MNVTTVTRPWSCEMSSVRPLITCGVNAWPQAAATNTSAAVKTRSGISSEPRRDRFGNLLAVEAAILDENFVGVHSRDNDASEVDAFALAFECLGVGTRTLGLLVQRDAERV